jgi:superfamily II DNA/RNA helicase
LSDTSDRPAAPAAEDDHTNTPREAERAESAPDAAAAPPPPEAEAAAEAATDADADADDDGAEGDLGEDPESDIAGGDEDDAEEDPPPPRVTFGDLGLSEPILEAVADAGYVTPTPIQEQAIPVVLMGRDVLGCAQTGTGKTAGFTLPMLDILASGRAKARMPRSLILEPTRELALQVAENFVKYGKHLSLTHALLIGGESMDEQRAVLEKGVDVLIATPGRLLDLFDRGRIIMADVKVLVIDEADRMLDMGFIPDVERIVSMLPAIRQTLFFSATMAPEIRRLADAFLSNPKEISVTPPASIAATIVAGLVWVRETDKREALRRILRREEVQNALIFCNRKVEVDVLYKSLRQHGFSVGALHGDMDQPSRFATLSRFREGEVRLLVCSDVAARGLDIGGLSHVFNFDVPFHAEDYVHRIGRTGRAGREGHAFTIAMPDDARNVAAIEALTGRPIPRLEIEGLDPVSAEELAEAVARPRRGRGGGRAGAGGSRSAGGRGRGSGSRTSEREAPARGGGRSGRGGEGRGRGDRAERAARDAEGAPARRARGGVDAAAAEGASARRGGGGGVDTAAAAGAERAPPRRERRSEDATAAAPRRRGERDDLGPAVQGFGDAVPAFMLIPIPRPRRETATTPDPADTEQEAA